jgi:hypothetical protein
MVCLRDQLVSLRPWMTRIRTTTMANTNRMWMNPPIVVDVTSPSSHKTSKITKIVQSIRILLCLRFQFQSPGSRREELEWEGALSDQYLASGFSSTTRAPRFFLRLPPTTLDERNAFVCPLVLSPPLFLRSSRPCVWCNQSLGDCDHVTRYRSGPDCQLPTGIPDKEPSECHQTHTEKNHAK